MPNGPAAPSPTFYPIPTLRFDFDSGSLPTAIEWVVGGDPTNGADDAGLAPTIDRTTDPNGKLLFTYRHTAAAKNDAKTTVSVEYGSTLGAWTIAVHQGTAANQINHHRANQWLRSPASIKSPSPCQPTSRAVAGSSPG